MKCDKQNMLLYAVTDRAWVGKQTLYEQVESALKGGVTCVQLRVIHLVLGCQRLHAGKFRSLFSKLNQQLFHLPEHGIVHLANGRQVHIDRIPHQILQTEIEGIRIFPIERIATMFQIIPENGDYVYFVHHLLRHFRMVKQKLVQRDWFEI